jgi:two-component system cell cycle sensor histidine kinase/response regulator CckA
VAVPRERQHDETVYFREYNEALIRKLENKVVQVEEARRRLEREAAERIRTEEALRLANERFCRLVESNIVGILIVNAAGDVIEANDYYLSMIGYSLEELAHGKVSWRSVTPPEWIPADDNAIRELRERGTCTPYEKEYIRRDGVVGTVFLAGAMLSGPGEEIVAFALDITGRKRVEEALRESEGKYRRLTRQFNALLDAIPDHVTHQSSDFRVIWANRAAAAGLKKETADLVGSYCYTLKHNRTSPCEICPVLKTFRTGEPALEIVTTPEGRTWELRSVPVKEAGSVVEVVEIGREITEHRKLEEQFLQAQKMEAVGRLAGGIAHDFNNALTGIVGFGELLRDRVAGDEQASHDLNEILLCAERAATLTRQLLTFARRQVIEPVNLDLSALVGNLMKLIGKVVGAHIGVKTSSDGNVPTIHADRGQIEQVLMNLCLNARDAMPKGGRLLVETRDVFLGEEYVCQIPSMTPGRYALLAVSDTGIGMDEATRARVFEPFFTTKGPDKGTGLGLAMVYGIVRQHDGFIRIDSEPGKGTAVNLYFPAVGARPDLAPERCEEVVLVGGKETILLADDEESIRSIVEQALKALGYDVLVARDGEEAVEISRRNEGIALAVLDMVMPRKGGKEAFEEMQKKDPRLKVIFMSGYCTDAIRDSSVSTAGASLLQKPFSPTKLARKIREVLDKA